MAEIDGVAVAGALGDLIIERDALRAEVERMKKHTWCAYCGHEILIDDNAASLIGAHIRTCEKHPIRAIEAELKAARPLLTAVGGPNEAVIDWDGNYVTKAAGDILRAALAYRESQLKPKEGRMYNNRKSTAVEPPTVGVTSILTRFDEATEPILRQANQFKNDWIWQERKRSIEIARALLSALPDDAIPEEK